MPNAYPSPLLAHADHTSPYDPGLQTGFPNSHTDSIHNDRCLDRWEDEGGMINFNQPEDIMSPVESHISKATAHMELGNVDHAVTELEHAAARLATYNSNLRASMAETIGQLSTQGCQATSPHPKALHLVRIRQNLPA